MQTLAAELIWTFTAAQSCLINIQDERFPGFTSRQQIELDPRDGVCVCVLVK